ncbi:type IVB secretion system protein IcmH/DotU [Trinickia sp. YCB016]
MTISTADLRNDAGVLASPPIAARLKAAEQAVNPLLEAARVLLYALVDTPEALDADAVVRRRRWLEHELRLFTRVCSELRLRPEHVRSASYCLCAALDEAAMQTSWGKGETTGAEWQTTGLAMAFGHDRQGGDRVFHLIDEAMRSPREHLDLIELFQNVLDLGFRGRYRFENGGQKRLLDIRERVHDVAVMGGLSGARVDEPGLWSRQTLDRWAHPAPARRSSLRIISGLAVALMLGAGGYAAVDHWVRAKQPAATSSYLDSLAQGLEERLRDEIVAGNVELNRDAMKNTLTLRFNGMYASGDVTVAPWWASVVASVGREIATSPVNANVRVAGYADSMAASTTHQGSNQALSEARARQVAQILVAAGVPMQRVDVTGQSDADPLADNGTSQGRARNRRVEVIVSN